MSEWLERCRRLIEWCLLDLLRSVAISLAGGLWAKVPHHWQWKLLLQYPTWSVFYDHPPLQRRSRSLLRGCRLNRGKELRLLQDLPLRWWTCVAPSVSWRDKQLENVLFCDNCYKWRPLQGMIAICVAVHHTAYIYARTLAIVRFNGGFQIFFVRFH